MATLNSFRSALDNKIWNAGISRTVTIYSSSSTATDAYGDEYVTFDAGTTTKAVPYNVFSYQRDFLKWGVLGDGESEMAFPYNTVISPESVIVDSNDTVSSYEVLDVEDFKFGTGIVAKVARLKIVLQ